MLLHPYLAPDDVPGESDKCFSQEEMQQLLSDKLSEEKQRYEAALKNEAAARRQAEALLQEREAQLRAQQLLFKAQQELKNRDLPSPLLDALNLTSEETLYKTLAAAESAFRTALEEGVRSRLRGQAPSLAPLPQKNRKTRTPSYQEAAASYLRDRQQH